jgi:hypothetical protein
MITEGITKEEFVKSFESVVSMITTLGERLKNANAEQIASMKDEITALADKLSASTTSDITAIRAQNRASIQDALDSFSKAWLSKQGEINAKLASIKNGEDGQDAPPVNIDEIIREVRARIPEPDLQPIRQELADALADLDKRINELPGRPTTTIFGPGKTKVIVLDLSNQLDGATKTFFVGTHFGIIAVDSSSAPFGSFRPVIDYNEVGRNIVFTDNVDASATLASGQNLIIRYLR